MFSGPKKGKKSDNDAEMSEDENGVNDANDDTDVDADEDEEEDDVLDEGLFEIPAHYVEDPTR